MSIRERLRGKEASSARKARQITADRPIGHRGLFVRRLTTQYVAYFSSYSIIIALNGQTLAQTPQPLQYS